MTFLRLSLLAFLVLFVMLAPATALAQDADPPSFDVPADGDDETADTQPFPPVVMENTDFYETIITALIGGLVVVVVVAGYVLRQNAKDMGKSIPPEVAVFLQGLAMVSLGIAQKRVDATATDLDNRLLDLLQGQLNLPARDHPPL